MARLIAFLGNPGNEYARTRHNIAWMFCDTIPTARDAGWKQQFKGLLTRIELFNQPCFLLKPQTYMNLSGQSVAACMKFHSIQASDLIVVHDELEQAFGEASWRFDGGQGGHNGLRSIISSIGTADFYRFRLGISRPTQQDVSSWVLSPFSSQEQPLLPDFLSGAFAFFQETFIPRQESIAQAAMKRKILLN